MLALHETDLRRRRRTFGYGASSWRFGFAVVLLACSGCTSTAVAPVQPKQSAELPVEFSDDGKIYLKNVYRFICASEYLPYPDGEGPEVPPRTASEWSQRERELNACREEVAERYTALETVRMMTWNGTEHTMSDAEMRGIVRHGEDFLREYLDDLLEAERLRGGFSRPRSTSMTGS